MEKKTDFKALSTKAKAEYLWDYYKLPFFITVIVASFVIYMIYHYVTYRDPLLNVIMLNCASSAYADDSGFDEFLAAYGYDSDNQYVSLNSTIQISEDSYSSYDDYEVLAMLIAAGGQDLFFGTGDIYVNYANEGALLDLSEVLSADLMETYADSLLYATEEDTGYTYPCAIELTDNAWLTENYYYDTCYFGIFYQTQNLEASVQFAEFLLNYETAQ